MIIFRPFSFSLKKAPEFALDRDNDRMILHPSLAKALCKFPHSRLADKIYSISYDLTALRFLPLSAAYYNDIPLNVSLNVCSSKNFIYPLVHIFAEIITISVRYVIFPSII